MTIVDFVVSSRAPSRELPERRQLEELERRLVQKLDHVPSCPRHSQESHLKVYGEGITSLTVAVVDCCCDRQAHLLLEVAQGEIHR